MLGRFLRGVPREQKMLKGCLPRVESYITKYTSIRRLGRFERGGIRLDTGVLPLDRVLLPREEPAPSSSSFLLSA